MFLEQTFKLPLLGDRVPSFEAQTTRGRIRFPEDYRGEVGCPFLAPCRLHACVYDRVRGLSKKV